jgi:glycosyltransferase involved in cell wall biosynthesis
MDGHPRITVIIPARNEEQYIAGALERLRKQDFPHTYEVIVVDNASVDRTVDRARQFDVHVIKENRMGVQFARERGRKEARGEIIAYLDADCLPPPDWLTKGRAAFLDPKVVGVSGPYDYCDGSRIFRSLSMFVEKIFFSSIHYVVHDVLHVGGIIIGGNAFLRADAMEKIGGFDTSIAFYGDDTDTACRVAKTGRLIFNRDLIVESSARRFQSENYLKVNLRYIFNFLTVLVFHKPFSQ